MIIRVFRVLLLLLLLPCIGNAQEENNARGYNTTAIYQIYPRSYMDSNGDGIGDLEGVISKLDYIKSCGFQTIWLSPFFTSPQKDFGYDISDYRGIAPEYGDSATVDRLIQEVHARGMKIVFDMVMNHTSDQHPWFKESRSSKDNPKRDWYVWHEGKGRKKPPTNWKAMIGGSGWTLDTLTNEWYWASFLGFQPDLNYHNPEVKKAMLDNVRYWLDKGVDGFRLDIFNSIYEDSLFRNNPFSFRIIPSETNPNGFFQKMKYTVNQPESFAFAKELRQAVDEYVNPPRFLVGEVFGDHATLRQYLGEHNDGLNFIFLFEILDFDFSAKYFRKVITTFEKEYPYPYTPTYVFSNHDRKRSISRMNNDVRKARLLALFQMTVRGMATTYQGEEIGMEQAYIPLKQAQDILAQNYDWIPQFMANMSSESLNRDECRTPMQWDSTANAGFSPAGVTPWLPVNKNYKAINVQAEDKDPNSLLNTYRQLLTIRNNETAFQGPPTRIVTGVPKKILAYNRNVAEGDATIFINFSKKTMKFKNPKPYSKVLFTAGEISADAEIVLGPYSGLILSK